MTENREPKTVEVPTILSDGVFGISIKNIEHMTTMNNLIVFWFNKEHMTEEHGWDLEVPFDTPEEAEESLREFQTVMRKMIMKRIK